MGLEGPQVVKIMVVFFVSATDLRSLISLSFLPQPVPHGDLGALLDVFCFKASTTCPQ